MPEWIKSLFVTAAWFATALDVALGMGFVGWSLRRASPAPISPPPGTATAGVADDVSSPTIERRQARVTAWVLIGGTISGLALCFFETFAMFATGKVFGGFGPIRIVFLAGAFVPPAVVLAALIARMRGHRFTPAAALTAIVLLVPTAIIAHAALIAPYQWVIERTDVPMPHMASGASPIRVVVLADVQTDSIGWPEQRAFDLALAEKPDIVLLPGDFFQGPDSLYERWEDEWHAWMSRLNPPFGAYACMGNIDPVERGDRLFAGTPVRMLRNEVIEVDVRGTRVAIGGLEWKFDLPEAREARRKLCASDAAVRLLVAHTPDAALVRDADLWADLVVSGHTHGGQIVVPGFGPPLTFTDVPREVAAGGLHDLNGRMVYVSRGVGMERGIAPPMRFLCPPEISVLTLRPLRDGPKVASPLP